MSSASDSNCLQCKSEETVAYCLQCKGNLCQNCRSGHTNIPVCSNHVLRDIQSIICFLCSNTDTSYFCPECNGKLCPKCVSTHAKIPACLNHKLEAIRKSNIDDKMTNHMKNMNVSDGEVLDDYQGSNSTSVRRSKPKEAVAGSDEAKSEEKRPSVMQLVGKFDSKDDDHPVEKTPPVKTNAPLLRQKSKNDDTAEKPKDKIVPDSADSLTATMRSLFQHFDKDKNGVIDRKEFKLVFDNLKMQISPKEFDTAMTIVDTNRDGVIDYEEFIALFMKL